MGRKTPPFKAYPKWTEAKVWSFIRSGLRSKSSRWPPKYEALAKAKRPYKGKDKRRKFSYQCNVCKKWWMGKEVSVDHIIPVGSLKCFNDLPKFVERLFCGVNDMQVLCKHCHDKKTKEERK